MSWARSSCCATAIPSRSNSGASVYIESEVPRNKGVSSSAAVEVAVMKAAAACYGIDLHGIELAEACQWVENVIAESACGIMDQAASVLGDEGHVLPLLCQPCVPRPLVKLPEGLRCWAIDSGVRHAVTGIEYEAARAAAFIGYRMICEWENLPIQKEESGPNSPLYRSAMERFSLQRRSLDLPLEIRATLAGVDFRRRDSVSWRGFIRIRSPPSGRK